jgi:carboxylesterase type B
MSSWLTFNGTSTGVNGTTVYTAQNTAERALGAEVIAYWLSFVRTGGDPNAYKLPRSPQWPNYTAPSRQRVVIQAVDDANGALVNTSAIVAEKEPEIQVQRCEKVRKIADQQQA